MKRRAFLGTVTLGITTIAGCLSRADPDEQPSGESGQTPTDQPAPSEQTSDHERVPTGETTDATLGEGTLSDDGARRPHGIVLENPTDETRIGALVVRRPDDSVALEETYELEAGATVAVSLTDPLRYSADVTIPETGASDTVDVELAWFDCNSSSTNFTVQSDGQVEHATVSTKMACTNVDTEHVSAGEETSLSVGDGSLSEGGERKPHGVTVTNPTDDTWTGRLLIVGEKRPLLDGIYTLEPEASASVTLTEAGRYQGTASIPATGGSASFEVEPDQFDCNNSSTNVTIGADGTIDATTVSTLMACQTGTADGNGTADE